MRRFIYRWRRPSIVILIVIALTVLLGVTRQVRGPLAGASNWISTAVSPASSSLAYLGHEVGVGLTTVGDIFTLQQQNRQLKQELMQYKSTKLQLAQIMADNSRLRSVLGLKQKLGHWKLTTASVIARNPSNWFSTLVLDRGSSSGIRPGMSVIVPQGVVGRVVSVSPDAATVMLLLDPKSGVGAMDSRSQSAGVILGQQPIKGILRLQLFSHRPNVLPGDTITTSGYSQYYPKGLLIGQVTAVKKSNFGLTEYATVQPAVNFNRLQTVLVVRSHPSGTSIPPVFGGGTS